MIDFSLERAPVNSFAKYSAVH